MKRMIASESTVKWPVLGTYFSVVLWLLLAPLPASSHHSAAPYRTDQVVSVQGTVTSVDWTNPHTYFFIDDSEGRNWRIEGNATSILRRNGWTRDAVAEGDDITVRFNPARAPDQHRGRLLSVTTTDGEILSGRSGTNTSATASAADDSNDLQGVWMGNSEQAFDLLFAFIDHPLTEKGNLAKSQFDPSRNPIAECITWPTPRLTAWTAFYLSKIELDEDVAYIRNEFDEVERTIYMDGRPHPHKDVHFLQGHSIGWWEGETLVVDTSNFSPHPSPVADGIPSGVGKHVVERLTLTEGGAEVALEISVDDPEVLAETFEAELTWYRASSDDFYPFKCDPEISRRYAE